MVGTWLGTWAEGNLQPHLDGVTFGFPDVCSTAAQRDLFGHMAEGRLRPHFEDWVSWRPSCCISSDTLIQTQLRRAAQQSLFGHTAERETCGLSAHLKVDS